MYTKNKPVNNLANNYADFIVDRDYSNSPLNFKVKLYRKYTLYCITQ